ncbi:phosphopentomutase/2,3-bisphosphoglycerate-independent phosphoglycerate mutase family metalloenzyme [Chitinophaga niastensis]|uniref:Phosphopentomutase/2, 3-bisphosphoglycerate-independent phosphoglycerate mutase family metalloenzyme n=1 Tax=Chitinophaga niastensis TaxID=536980 RepID=A0A2P8HDM9_CHINA|nr:alkaline phosphatase family protein [Chitinophaga niastensis]PSL44323.1 phosphopentomutase/2,3-bisphosphoglycerate-independent phosphoglycerate mutase family metalloenzyme [Chitinophaga niastensis]
MKMKSLLLLASLLMCTATDAQQKYHTQNIIYISIDGYRWKELFRGAEHALLVSKKYNSTDTTDNLKHYWSDDIKERRKLLMPFTWDVIEKHGQLYGNRDLDNNVNVRNKAWISYPGRAESLTGYADPAITTNSYPDNPNDNVLEFLNNQKGFKGKVVTFASWDVVGRIVNRNRNGMLVNIPFENLQGNNLSEAEKLANETQHYAPKIWGDDERLDANTYAIARSYIFAHHPRVVYLDLADTDDYGHDGKYDAYLQAIHNIDKMIGHLWQGLQQDDFYKNKTTFIIVPDHGRGDDHQWTSHGSSIPHANDTWLLVFGPDTPPLGEMKGPQQLYQDQFAKTLAAFLGFNFTSKQHPVGQEVTTVFMNPQQAQSTATSK